ncbi:MAG: hypothetical protein ACQETE_01695 [Bacteroidota bacterium]
MKVLDELGLESSNRDEREMQWKRQHVWQKMTIENKILEAMREYHGSHNLTTQDYEVADVTAAELQDHIYEEVEALAEKFRLQHRHEVERLKSLYLAGTAIGIITALFAILETVL